MRLKLDENFGRLAYQVFVDAGHDVATVKEQDLTGADDADLISICGDEDRVLVTLDMDFANPLNYPPQEYAGIAVLRLPQQPTRESLVELARTFSKAAQNETIDGKLWIVEIGRIRFFQPYGE